MKNPKSVGAIAPSSAQLADAMVRGISELEPGSTVLELGPGTGAFTAAIRDSLPAGVHYVGIEIEGRFVDLLRERFPGLEFAHGSAANAGRIVDERGRRPVRCVISGLPFASLPVEIQDGIVTALLDVLEPGAVFRTFQYVHAYRLPKAVRFRKQMGELFGRLERSKPVLRNLPPAYCLTWQRAAVRSSSQDSVTAHEPSGADGQ
ncbi:MAG: SAM-dependent methyltransferase [Planctomycetes bacterium]|nr:SAM-dependent methyltransferase [Planctomycetota bacterium]